MSYPDNGHVEPGGPSISRTVPLGDGVEVEVRKRSVGPMDNNAYLLVSGGEALLLDAANDASVLLEELESSGARLVAVLTTHGHADHWQALEQVVSATGADVLCHAADRDMIPVAATRHVDDDDTITFGAASARIIHNPGHTPGSVSVLLGANHLFTGDTLFPGGFGRTQTPEDFDTIYRYGTERLFDVMGDDVWVYPGHGDDTTIGAERPKLAEWRARGW